MEKENVALTKSFDLALQSISLYKFLMAKLSIAYREARETRYWLKLLQRSGYLNANQVANPLKQCGDICRLLGKSISTVKSRTTKIKN